MNKIIVINGPGKSGKDKIVSFVEDITVLPVENISSVDKIKEAAIILGWRNKKEPKDRQFLSDIKKLSIEYCDHPINYILSQLYGNEDQIYFVHIRETAEIDKLKKVLKSPKYANYDFYTWFVYRGKSFFENNRSDDENIMDYPYDYYIDNTGRFERTERQIYNILDDMDIEHIDMI